MTTLPPYSGPETECPKCHATHADTEWQPCNASLSAYGQVEHRARDVEKLGAGWLLRTCSRCRYPWAEATRDSNVAVPVPR